MTTRRILNINGGPGIGKSTIAAGVFYACKRLGANVELISEYAKDATWEGRMNVLTAQDYVFAKQHYRIARCIDQVDFVVTDSPLLLSHIYIAKDTPIPALHLVVDQAYDSMENLDILLTRGNYEYNETGRNQNLQQAIELDHKITRTLDRKLTSFGYHSLAPDEHTITHIMQILQDRGWIIAAK